MQYRNIYRQLPLLREETKEPMPAKRVNIVTVKLVRESSMLYKGRQIRSPKDSYDLIRTFIEDSDREMMICLSLDTKNQPASISICSIGSVSSAIVHPREIMKTAILSNASSVIIFHNHPSGNTTPSAEDIGVTKRLKEAGEILGIELLDHLIIGNDSFISLKEKGYL